MFATFSLIFYSLDVELNPFFDGASPEMLPAGNVLDEHECGYMCACNLFADIAVQMAAPT
jgi:hypothetical protein